MTDYYIYGWTQEKCQWRVFVKLHHKFLVMANTDCAKFKSRIVHINCSRRYMSQVTYPFHFNEQKWCPTFYYFTNEHFTTYNKYINKLDVWDLIECQANLKVSCSINKVSILGNCLEVTYKT